MANRSIQLPDQHSRDQIVGELDRTMLVEAAAGTGKTTCLIARMVGLLAKGKCRIETLAAVTFTRKAAAELRTRFQLALEAAVHEAAKAEREKLTEALKHVERCFVGTIHSFCARLLRERPVEAGVDPGFVELDEVLDDQLRRQAWREHVARLIATDDAVLPELERLGLKVTASTRRSTSLATELDELGLEPAELGPAFLRYAEFSDVDDWPAQPVPLPDLKRCIQELSDYADHMQATVAQVSEYGNDKLLPKYELIGRMVRGFDLQQPAQLMEVLEQFTGQPKIVHKQWPGKKAQAVEEQQRWDTFTDEYAQPLLLAWREHRYEPVMRAIRPARDIYDQLRRERNGLNFQDLLLVSVALLRDNPEVRRYFRERFTHLLVDEFQDTDPLQAEVMMLLTADDPSQRNWQQCRPVAGSLFVVGDPKQSIYRFRRADILTYNKVHSIVQGVGGQVIPLTTNFRSVKPLIDWVNGCFSHVFSPDANEYSPADRQLDLGRADGAKENSIARLLIPADMKRQDLVAEYEADMIARTIRRAIDEKWPVPRTEAESALGMPDYATPGDFLLVARMKPGLTTYASKLQQYGIPHAVTGGSVLNEVPELALLHGCLLSVTRSDDPIALVAVLRGGLFGVSDTLLYDFRRLRGRFSYYSPIPEGLPEYDADVLRDAFERLKSYARWLRRLPAAAAIEWIAGDLGLIARACAAEKGDSYAGSLLKAIELLRNLDGQLTAEDYVDALGRLVDRTEQYDGVPVRPTAEMPVRVMNLHQCKGLEAPYVFLVDPSRDLEHDVGVHIDRSGEKPRGYLAIYGPKRGQWERPPVLAQPLRWNELATQEQRFLDAESNRLLYVAATRAGVRLVISQRDGNANQKNPWKLFDSYLPSAAPFVDPGSVSLKPAVTLTIDAAEWRNEVESIDARWRQVIQPTYAVQAIKESTILGGPKPHGAETGGAEWGDVLHTLLEAKMKQPQADLQGLAAAALESEGLPVTLIEDAVTTVKRVAASQIWRRAQSSTRCLTEIPLALPVPAAEATSGLATVLRGVIDLVFLESTGWVIVDYKSERVETEKIPALVAYYQPQIDAYAAAWEKVVGQPVVERGLFFTHSGKYVTLPHH